jgi:redox-sensitive bicupin YhaK (pirin superfamily)
MIDTLITPRTRDLGDGFQVRRALPDAKRRSVGPFVFFDQMGPSVLEPGRGLDVRPHPHIGLATVTYLFEGEIMHRDSLGVVQPIRPGEVNWMTAGRGIVHSERTADELRATASRVFGIQTWVGLPRADEEMAPGFVHFGAADLPTLEEPGVRARVILGELGGARSPVPTRSATFYADVELNGGTLALDTRYAERGAYVVKGSLEIAEAGQMIVFQRGADVKISARGARVMVFGGEPLDGERFIWWNFVSSRRERIAQAAADWKAGRFPGVPGETEWIPLPDKPPPGAVHYP